VEASDNMSVHSWRYSGGALRSQLAASSRRVNLAVAAVNNRLQFATGAIAYHSNLIPAIIQCWMVKFRIVWYRYRIQIIFHCSISQFSISIARHAQTPVFPAGYETQLQPFEGCQ
jgi:hypothetical protein